MARPPTRNADRKATMELTDMFSRSYSGTLVGRFGARLMFNCAEAKE